MNIGLRICTHPMLAAAVFLGGCSIQAHIGATPEISKDDLAKQVKAKLEAQAGRKADSVVCNGPLAAKVGATQRCVLTVDQTKLGVSVDSTAVDTATQTIDFHVKVDNQPMP